MKKFRKYNKLFILLITLLILWINYNTFYNAHYHILDSGKIISHAHPFQKSADNQTIPKHHHTRNELILLNHFYKILFLILVFIFLIQFIIKCKKCFFENYSTILRSIVLKTIVIRGPPILILNN